MPAVIQTAICSQGMEATMTVAVTREAQTSTNFVARLLVVLGDSPLRAVALFSTLGVLASIYFAMHLPVVAPLPTQFP
jgi:hypothetical protein